MTRRDFEAIAEVIRELYPRNGEIRAEAGAIRFDVAERFATYLETTNPRFDRARFIAAATREVSGL